MNNAQKNDPLQPQNATTAAASGHTFSDCSTADKSAPAQQLESRAESPPNQRVIEIRTPHFLKLNRG